MDDIAKVKNFIQLAYNWTILRGIPWIWASIPQYYDYYVNLVVLGLSLIAYLIVYFGGPFGKRFNWIYTFFCCKLRGRAVYKGDQVHSQPNEWYIVLVFLLSVLISNILLVTDRTVTYVIFINAICLYLAVSTFFTTKHYYSSMFTFQQFGIVFILAMVVDAAIFKDLVRQIIGILLFLLGLAPWFKHPFDAGRIVKEKRQCILSKSLYDALNAEFVPENDALDGTSIQMDNIVRRGSVDNEIENEHTGNGFSIDFIPESESSKFERQISAIDVDNHNPFIVEEDEL